MTKLLVNFTRNFFHLLWLQNSGCIYSGIIIPVNVRGKYSTSSFKIRRLQRYCLHNVMIASVRSSILRIANQLGRAFIISIQIPFFGTYVIVRNNEIPWENLISILFQILKKAK